MNDLQFIRLQEAKEKGKFGNLETWEELYWFQRSMATPLQIKEISEWAKRFNKGEGIKLPLKENV